MNLGRYGETKIFAKSAFNNQRFDRLLRNPDGLEIQLLNLDVKKEFTDSMNLDEVPDSKIYAVHSPLTCGRDLDIADKHSADVFEQVFACADLIGEVCNRNIIVIAHLYQSIESMNVWDGVSQVVKYLNNTVNKYKHIIIGIENTSMYPSCSEGLKVYNTTIYDCLDLAKICNNERIGVVFDTCHALMSTGFMQMINREISAELGNKVKSSNLFQSKAISNIFSQLTDIKDYVKLIHLSGRRGWGIGINHGIPLSYAQDRDFIKEILETRLNNGIQCPITLEVREDDINKAENFSETLKAIQRVSGVSEEVTTWTTST